VESEKRKEQDDGGKLGIEELLNICPIPDIVRMIKSRVTRWEKHVARLGDTRKHIIF
jgi:hypothetical protein